MKLMFNVCLFVWAMIGFLFPLKTMAKNCVYVSSYHKGHEPTDEMYSVFMSKIKGKCDVSVFYMDSKNNQDRTFIKNKGLEAKALIEEKKPELVVVADDNAISDLLKPYFRDSSIPFIFIGVNWSIEKYELPYKNTTGMIEVDPVQPLIQELIKTNPNIKTITRLSPKNETSIIVGKHLKKYYADSGLELVNNMVENFEEWKKAFQEGQAKTDAVFMGGYQGVKGFDKAEAVKFVEKHAKKLVYASSATMYQYATFVVAKRFSEHGEFAGDAAIKILKGTNPRDIAITTNKSYDSFINPKYHAKFPLKFTDTFTKRISKLDPMKIKE